MTGKKLIPLAVFLLLVNNVLALGEESAAISITIFILASAIMVFCVPFIVKRFAKSEVIHISIKNSIHALGIGLMFLNTSIMREIVSGLSWDVGGALNLYLRIFGYLMIFLIGVTMWRTTIELTILKQNKRMGVNVDD